METEFYQGKLLIIYCLNHNKSYGKN